MSTTSSDAPSGHSSFGPTGPTPHDVALARELVGGLAEDYVRGACTLLDELGLPSEALGLAGLLGLPSGGRAA